MTTFDPANKSAFLTLSGSDLIVTSDLVQVNSGARIRSTTTKGDNRYTEILIGAVNAGDQYFGVCNSSLNIPGGYGPYDANFTGMSSGAAFAGGAYAGAAPTFGAGDIVSQQLDPANGIRWRVNGGTWSSWFALPSGTDWYVCSMLTPLSAAAASQTGNFGGSAFAYSLPSGALGWDASAPTPVILSRSFRTLLDGQRLSHPLAANEPVTWSVVSGDIEIVGGIVRWLGNIVEPVGSYSVTVRATNGASGETDQVLDFDVIANTARDAGNDNEGTPTFFDNSLAADFVWADFFDTDDSVHVLTATALATGTPSLGAPSLSGLHSLAASALAAGTPSLGNPAVSQKQSLAANSLDGGTPTLGAPAFTIVQTFVATGLSAGSPTLGTPAQTQGHLLTATALATGTPALGAPSITQRSSMVATALAAGTPTLGAPAVTGKHSLSANGLAAGTPAFGTPGLSLKNIFTAVGLSTPAPVLGLPLLLIAGVMTPVSLAAGVPVLGSPSVTQRHGLAPVYLTAGTPALGAPIVAQVNRLTATGIAAGTPALGAPAVQQQHKITAVELAAGTPALDSVTLVLAYQIQADELVWYAPILGAPDLNYVPPVIPADRMITLAPVSTMLTPDAPYVIVTPPRQPCTIILAGYEEVFMSSEYFQWPDKLAPAVIFYGVDWARRLGEASIVSHNFELIAGSVTLTPRTSYGTETSVEIAGGTAGSIAVIIASAVASDGETHAIRVSIDIA